jgi:hypothetical protein
MSDNFPDNVRRPSKQQKMSEDSSEELVPDVLPSDMISDHVLPFVDRSTWDNLVIANREIYEESRNLEAPWPMGELGGVGYEGHDIDHQFCFSSDGKHLCVLFSQDHSHIEQQRIRVWHKVVGSCGCIAFDDSNDRHLWCVCFSPVEHLLVSLHKISSRVAAIRL